MIRFLIFAFITLFILFFVYVIIYRNKFQLIFIFGKKGSGKSSLLVKMMYKYGKKGFTIYTNMGDCIYPGARIIKIEEIGQFIPLPYSILCLDEVGIDYDARKFKQFKDDTRDFYKYQRHHKILCFMASQTWDVDKKVRDLVDKFYLCLGAGPISIARKIVRKVVLTESTGDQESRISDNLKFTFPTSWIYTWLPNWQKFFNSFVAPEKPFIRYRINDSPYGIIRYRKPGKKKFNIYKIKKANSKQNKKFVIMHRAISTKRGLER